uniref:Golgi transport 1Ba n=1 Tax=Myripristis murdjan TaxID=586833 RepID=A0A668A3G7_9TELE
MISLTDSQKIGMGLTGFGVFFLFFGMILFFDKALLAIGNILFVAGLAFVIGLERTFRFFFQKHKIKATSFFLGGVFVVLIGWPIIGVLLEIYGFFLLFRGFFPVVIGFIRRIPVLGSILNLPFISAYVDKVGESNTMGHQSLVPQETVTTGWSRPGHSQMSLISSPPNASRMKTEDSPQSTVDSLQVAFVLCGITQNTPERSQGEEVDRELVLLSHYRACALTLFGQKPSIPIFVSLCSHFMVIFFLSRLFECSVWQLPFFSLLLQ